MTQLVFNSFPCKLQRDFLYCVTVLYTSDNVVLDTFQPTNLGRESKVSEKHKASILSVDIIISLLFSSLLLSAAKIPTFT